MHSRWFCLAIRYDGTTVALSGVADPVAEAGSAVEDFVGRKAWEKLNDRDTDRCQRAFYKCVSEGTDQTFEFATTFGGTIQRWRTRYIRCQMPSHVIAITELRTECPRLSEIDVKTLSLLIAGATNREIANKLSINETAVSQRLIRLRQKFGARTSAQLAVLASQHGIH